MRKNTVVIEMKTIRDTDNAILTEENIPESVDKGKKKREIRNSVDSYSEGRKKLHFILSLHSSPT